MNRIRCLITLIALLLTLPANASSQVELHTIHFPPYAIDAGITPPNTPLDELDGLYGADVELVRAAFADQGVTATFKVAPWKRIMRDVRAGLVLGVISCRPIPSRKAFSYFSDPVSQSSMVMATRKGLWGDQSSYPISQMRGQFPVTMAGWAQETILTNFGIDYSVVNGIDQGASLILHRNRNVFMTDKESLVYVLEEMDALDQFSFYSVEGMNNKDYTVCISKAYPNSKHYLDLLNQGLENLYRNGKAQAIHTKYGLSSPSPSHDKQGQ